VSPPPLVDWRVEDEPLAHRDLISSFSYGENGGVFGIPPETREVIRRQLETTYDAFIRERMDPSFS
jgi:hypothetical protein